MQLAHHGHEFLTLFKVGKKLAYPLVVDIHVEVVSLQNNKPWHTMSVVVFDKPSFCLLPVALKSSPPTKTSTLVSNPSHFRIEVSAHLGRDERMIRHTCQSIPLPMQTVSQEMIKGFMSLLLDTFLPAQGFRALVTL
jgi:hypothetical protein